MLTGFIFMSFVRIEELLLLAMIANPLIILGHVFLYIGVQQFLEIKMEKLKPAIFFLIFNLVYYYFMFINNSTSARTILISVTLSLISFMISYLIFLKKNKNVSSFYSVYRFNFFHLMDFLYFKDYLCFPCCTRCNIY
jgi:hypothetical protein